MKVNYKFADRSSSEVEVNEEIGAVIVDLRRKEENLARKERYHCVHMEDSEYEGYDYIDEESPESIFMEQFDNKYIIETLDKLSETQRKRLLMLASGMSIREIARIEGVSHPAVINSIESSRKIFKKFFKKGYQNSPEIS